MKHTSTFFLLLFFTLVSCAQTRNLDSFDKFIDSLMHADSIPGATLVVAKDGRIIKQKAYGFSNVENNVSASTTTEYELASVSKPFTATAIMILVEQGKLALDSSIGKYLSNVPESYREVTIRHLMSHTSGAIDLHFDNLKLYGPSILRYSVQQQLNDLFGQKLKFSPGTKYSYSSAGFFLLAAILEKVTGQSYQQFIKSNIFEKAGMDHSFFINGDSIVINRAQGYTHRKGTLVRFSLEQTIQAVDANGFGGIISTAGDLVKLCSALTDYKIIKKESLEQMMTPTMLSDGTFAGPEGGSRIGLSWFVKPLDGKKTISHAGQTGTVLVYFPNDKLTVVLLTNLGHGYASLSDQGFPAGAVGFQLASIAARKYLSKN